MNWNIIATHLLKSELAKQGISYEALKDKLSLIGIHETANSLNIKINRGSFSFIFFLQCAKAIGIKNFHIEEILFHQN